MLIPKNSRKQKRYEKVCSYPECNKIFFGISIAKYCVKHRQEEFRIRKRDRKSDPEKYNQLIEHKNMKVTEVTATCSLDGCNHKFSFKLFPKQKVYPKYCEEHRNEFQRERFKELHGRIA